MDSSDNLSTAANKDWASVCLTNTHQGSEDSTDLIKFSPVSSHSFHQLNSSDSYDVPSRPTDGENDSILTESSDYDASLEINANVSHASYPSAVHGSMSEAPLLFTDEVPDQTLPAQTSNPAAEHFQKRRSARQFCLALLAVLRGISANVHNDVAQMCIPQETKDASQPPAPVTFRLSSSTVDSHGPTNCTTKDAITSTSRHGQNIASTSPFANQSRTPDCHQAESPPGQVASSRRLSKSHQCCIGVLSAFEEEHLCHEDKRAILEGGCHGLCGLQITTNNSAKGYDKDDEDFESSNSSPCVKGPYGRPARFISAMPSAIMPDGRRGPTSTQPRFSRRRCAAQYQQPRQPLPLVQHPPHSTINRSECPVFQSSPQKTSTMLNSHSTGSKVMASRFTHKHLDLPESRLKANRSTDKDKLGHAAQTEVSDAASKQENQRKRQKSGELSDAVSKEKKGQGNMYSRFSSLFRMHESF